MALLGWASLFGTSGGVCPVCGSADCRPAPDVPWPKHYPFLPGGYDPMEGKTHVTAPHRIVDHELGRVVYGTGDAVPLEDAIKYGLVSKSEAKKLDEPTPVAAKPGRRTRHRQGPEESR